MVKASNAKPLYTPPAVTAGRLGVINERTFTTPVRSLKPSAPLLNQPEWPSNQPKPRFATVGDYYKAESAASAAHRNRILRGVAELAPPVLIGEMLYIKHKHSNEADDAIDNLPWDAAGKWRLQAARIKQREAAEASAEIGNLPLVSATKGTVQAIGHAADVVGDYASDATIGMINSARHEGREAMKGLLGALAIAGQGVADYANDKKQDFR